MEPEQIAIELYKVHKITKWFVRVSLFGNK
jgi:hypothetical protein